VQARLLNPYKKEPTLPYGKFHIYGNFLEDSPEVSNDNWQGVVLNGGTEADKMNAKAAEPFPAETINMQSAVEAYRAVLQSAGASYRRDTLDSRIIRDVTNRTGKIIDVQGGFPHGTAYEQTVNAWPALAAMPAPRDTDGDGIPDDWERANKLDPNNASDASLKSLHKHYTNIEMYCNSILSEKSEQKL
jgi:hypothetical protein